jgi:1-deoxyxylulose-5-phosphate synthase
MRQLTRREFLAASAAAAAMARVSTAWTQDPPPSKRTAVDRVTLGKSGLKASRVGLGTGSQGGQVQRDLGQAGFERLVRYAYDQGIRYIDTADAYKIHGMLKSALQRLPREELYLQTKIGIPDAKNVRACLDRFRSELGTDYLDSVLIHCTMTTDWPDQLKQMRDDLAAAKDQQVIRAHGTSIHGLKSLSVAPDCDWIDVGLVRINPQGKHVDGPTGQWDEAGDVPQALEQIRRLHAAGKGVIGMKIIGNGSFTDPGDREKSIRYVMGLDCVDAVVIGFSSPQEIDEAIERIDRALAGA